MEVGERGRRSRFGARISNAQVTPSFFYAMKYLLCNFVTNLLSFWPNKYVQSNITRCSQLPAFLKNVWHQSIIIEITTQVLTWKIVNGGEYKSVSINKQLVNKR